MRMQALAGAIAASFALTTVHAQEVQTQTPLDAAADSIAPAEVGVDPAEFLDPEALDDLVAPVALYPDSLLAQVLVAATYPEQVVAADRLLDESAGLSEDEMTARLAAEKWDPSVLVLASGFPTVLQRMADDLESTEQLGNAMVLQDEDVLAAVQRKRAEAQAVGSLASNEAQVVTQDAGKIAIAPADPDIVYVPSYDPQTTYQSSRGPASYVAPAPQTGLANPLIAGAITFGAALLVQELFGGSDDDDNDDGWDDYWHGGRQVDWNSGQFYPRPHRDRGWASERDRYWNPSERRWHRTGPARRAYAADRRDTLGWLVVRDPDTRERKLRGFRQHARWTPDDERELQQARRAAVERREAREARERQADRRERAREARQERREARLAEERREARERAAAAARKEKRADAIADRRAKAAAEAKAKAAADRRKAEAADRRAAERKQARQEERRKAAARQEAKEDVRKAAAERRTKDAAADRRRDKAQREAAAKDDARRAKARKEADAARQVKAKEAKAKEARQAKARSAEAERRADAKAAERRSEAKRKAAREEKATRNAERRAAPDRRERKEGARDGSRAEAGAGKAARHDSEARQKGKARKECGNGRKNCRDR